MEVVDGDGEVVGGSAAYGVVVIAKGLTDELGLAGGVQTRDGMEAGGVEGADGDDGQGQREGDAPQEAGDGHGDNGSND